MPKKATFDSAELRLQAKDGATLHVTMLGGAAVGVGSRDTEKYHLGSLDANRATAAVALAARILELAGPVLGKDLKIAGL